MAFLATFTVFATALLCGLGLASPFGKGQIEKRAAGIPSPLSIEHATLTSKWIEGSDYVQIIEMVLTNKDSVNSFNIAHGLTITASSEAFDLVKSAKVKRLMADQQVVVQVGVKNKAGVTPGSACTAIITATWAESYSTSTRITGKCGFGNYTADTSSLSWHWTPDWYNNAKFGIFIHWGIYSVPAYGNTNAAEDYAEWYWKRQHEPGYRSQTYQYHLATYGPDVNYDDFIANFTGSNFVAKDWVDLFAEAGAKYVVPVTKHHDGYALFDIPASTSDRSSVKYGPKRDFINELLDAAKTYHPDMRRGTYFSLPEWYHPEYKKYGITWGGGFPGGPPTNPYTNETISYTGYIPIDDFVVNLQYPQMQTLAYDPRYETEIMWCDIGNANNSTLFASTWINWAREKGRQVTFNDRCGIPGDFNTPEYYTNTGTVIPKWESNRGMDPFSFGYNHQTPDSDYLTGNDIVQSLVDIVSKNGNFLLDIGPKADGTIPEIMQKGLKDAGAWIHAHSESIFGSRFWQTMPGLDPFRYTVTDDAFYIHVNTQPGNRVLVPNEIPFFTGDTVTVIGGNLTGTVVPATLNANGSVSLSLSDEVIAADKYVWTFKVNYSS